MFRFEISPLRLITLRNGVVEPSKPLTAGNRLYEYQEPIECHARLMIPIYRKGIVSVQVWTTEGKLVPVDWNIASVIIMNGCTELHVTGNGLLIALVLDFFPGR